MTESPGGPFERSPPPIPTPMPRPLLPLFVLLLLVLAPAVVAQGVEESPPVLLTGVPFDVTVRGGDETSSAWEIRTSDDRLLASGAVAPGGTATAERLVLESRDELPIRIVVGDVEQTLERPVVPGWFSLLPPLLAVLLALLFREVVTALFAGIWLGALAVAGFNPLAAVWRVVDTYAVPALADPDHASIVAFSLLLGGMVGVIARNGGTLGIVEAVAPLARSERRGKLATWLAGMAIFFDDYANTLIVGNTMRPITDRLRISREKLAYIVDSTAAPLAAIVPISTWVGYEITLIGDGLGIAAGQTADVALSAELAGANPFTVFLHTIPYLFYPLLALVLVVLTSAMNRDFGPMAAAELRARRGDGLWRPGAMLAADTSGDLMEAKEDTPHRWWNAALPVLTVIAVVVAGLYFTGRAVAVQESPDPSLMDVFGEADPFATLLWGSLAGCLVAIGLSMAQGVLTLEESMTAWVGGLKAMVIAMVILVLAWSLGAVTEDVGTARYLSLILEGAFPLELLPVLVFVTAAAIAFATGTSWGTMAILLPLVIPLAVTLGGGIDFEGGAHYTVLLGTISSVLAGAIFGDHCSPISDTTVLSSMAAGCDHVDHVRTQLPYAVLVAVVAMAVGDVPTAYGLPNWISLVVGALILWAFVRFRSERVDRSGPGDRDGPAAADGLRRAPSRPG